LDQRAWIAAANAVVDGISVDGIPEAKVDWFNSGKTFAKHVTPDVHFRLSGGLIRSGKELVEAAKSGTASPPNSGTTIGALGPQNKTFSRVPFDHKLTAVEKSDVDRSYTYFWGELIYFDTFKRKHGTIFCVFRQGTTGDFLQCPFHNDAD
jgi:hypothetical protein